MENTNLENHGPTVTDTCVKRHHNVVDTLWGPSCETCFKEEPKNAEDPFVVKDSGDRTQFPSGSVRDARAGKGRPSLLSPIALRRVAIHAEKGARKYSERNWELGQPLCASFFDSAQRHAQAWLEGLDDEDHMAAAIWNLCALLHTEEMIKRGRLPKELNDRPNYQPQNPPA